MSKPKGTRGRGRPRIHPKGTEVVSFRAKAGFKTLLGFVISAVKIANQQTHDSDVAIILDALKVRLRSLENRAPERTAKAISAIEAWLEPTK
jgi:hypothetical protein